MDDNQDQDQDQDQYVEDVENNDIEDHHYYKQETLTWVEKYRPIDLNSIVGNDIAINQFKTIAENGNIPHMILSGSPGTGKTTSIMCLAKILLKENFINGFLELNASDERGIEIIRNKITTFCKKKVQLPAGIHKIIFLDEMDSMTPIAQQALRRIIEIYSTTTRFVMACNSQTKIIEAIQSRCSIIRFSKIGIEDMKKRLIYICNEENIKYNNDGIESLLKNIDGDMRKAINNLQSIAITFGKITNENVNKLMDKPNYDIIVNLLKKCLDKNFDDSHIIIKDLINDGYPASDIINILFIVVKDNDTIDRSIKLKILSELGNTQMNIIQGGDQYIQLLSFIAKICSI